MNLLKDPRRQSSFELIKKSRRPIMKPTQKVWYRCKYIWEPESMLTNYLPPTRSVPFLLMKREHCFKPRMMEIKCICKTWRDQTCNRKKHQKEITWQEASHCYSYSWHSDNFSIHSYLFSTKKSLSTGDSERLNRAVECCKNVWYFHEWSRCQEIQSIKTSIQNEAATRMPPVA